MPKAIRTNWQTTIAGVGTILVALGGVLVAQFDGLSETVPNWNILAAAVLAGVGLILGKDADK